MKEQAATKQPEILGHLEVSHTIYSLPKHSRWVGMQLAGQVQGGILRCHSRLQGEWALSPCEQASHPRVFCQ